LERAQGKFQKLIYSGAYKSSVGEESSRRERERERGGEKREEEKYDKEMKKEMRQQPSY